MPPAFSGWEPGMLLNILQGSGCPHNKRMILPQMATVLSLRDCPLDHGPNCYHAAVYQAAALRPYCACFLFQSLITLEGRKPLRLRPRECGHEWETGDG